MSLDRRQCSKKHFAEAGRIELPRIIESLLGHEDKENDDAVGSQVLGSSACHGLESSSCSINITPHDGTLDRSLALQHCRRLENKDDTPNKKKKQQQQKRKPESQRHLNVVNILCRSKKRKLENRISGSRKQLFSSVGNVRLDTTHCDGGDRYGPLQKMKDGTTQLIESLASGGRGSVAVDESLGEPHRVKSVPVGTMVGKRDGGFCRSQSRSCLGNGEEDGANRESRGLGRDDSLTNITWLNEMSAPNTESFTVARGERPPYSYSALIQFALIMNPTGMMTLKDIYEWIQTTFTFFKTAKLGWKNSIRHNLSLHKMFIRQLPNGPGKPSFWTLRPGTMVRLPENRLFVTENNACEDRSIPIHRTMGAKACIKQADGTTQIVSGHRLQVPLVPKPMLPPRSQGCTLPTSQGGQSRQPASNRRYLKIAPKQTPGPGHWCLPSTSLADYSGIEVCHFKRPKRGVTTKGSMKSGDIKEVMEQEEKCNPVMSTPVKQSTSISTEASETVLPAKDDDYTLLRAQENILTITPIKGGMEASEIIEGDPSRTDDFAFTPARLGRPRRSPMTTPVPVERNDISFDLENLFTTNERIGDLQDDYADSGIEVCLFETPKRTATTSREGPMKSGEKKEVTERQTKCDPVTATLVKKSLSTEVIDMVLSSNDDDYTLLRAQEDILTITPIKGGTEISETEGLVFTPARLCRPRQSPMTTPVLVERGDVSFDFEYLFRTSERNGGDQQDELHDYSFSDLFSPVSKNDSVEARVSNKS